MPNTVGPWGSSSSGVNTIPGTPTPLATVTSATWGGIGGSIASQADLQTALAAKASLSGATFTGTVQSTGGLWSVTAAGVANFTSIASGVNWGGITGASAQASPAGGWTGDMNTTGKWKVGGNNILSNIGTTNYIWAGSGSSNALTVVDYTGIFVRLNIDGAGAATFASSVSMGALTATSGRIKGGGGYFSGPTLGSDNGHFAIMGANGLYGCYVGVSSNGDTWFQSQRNDANTTVYQLAFQPAGGNSVFGGPVFTQAVTANGNLKVWNGTQTFFSVDTTSGNSTFGPYAVSMGALTATSETISGLATWNGGGSLAAGYGIAIGDGAPGGTTGKLYSVATNQLMWNGSLILTIGNVGVNAATLQAAVASATAPKVGTHAQMIAYSVPPGTQPYWFATDDTPSDFGTYGVYGVLYQWNGSSWVATGTTFYAAGRVVAGVISAGAVGAQAIAADVALIGQVLRSTGFTAGTTTAAPTGFKMSGTAFTSYCYNGDTTGIYSTSLSSYMEIGSGCSLGGYALGSLVLGRLINAGMKVYSPGTYTWVCPPGITQVVVTLSGGGGSGCHDASNPGAGGGAGCLTVISSVTPGTSYTVVCGAGGAGTSTTSGNDGGNSTFNGLTAQGGAAGHTGGGGYGGGAGPLGQATSGNGAMAQMATGAVYIMCGQGARGGGGGTDPGSTQWQTGTGFGVGGGSSAAGPGYGSGSDGKTSGSTAAGGQGVVILRW